MNECLETKLCFKNKQLISNIVLPVNPVPIPPSVDCYEVNLRPISSVSISERQRCIKKSHKTICHDNIITVDNLNAYDTILGSKIILNK